MRNDQIFVLLLVILLPMSGCFDGAVGDATAEDDEISLGSTITHHEYSNGTIQISTNQNQIVEIIDVQAWHGKSWNSWDGYAEYWRTSVEYEFFCNDLNSTEYPNHDYEDGALPHYAMSGKFLFSDGGPCTYNIINNWDFSDRITDAPENYFPRNGPVSVVFVIHNVM